MRYSLSRLEILPVAVAERLLEQPSYLRVEPLRAGVARLAEPPVPEDSVLVALDALGHGHEFGDFRGPCRLAPVVEEQPRAPLVLREGVDAAQHLLHRIHVRQFAERRPDLVEASFLLLREVLAVLRQRPALPLDDLLQVFVLLVHGPPAHFVCPVVHRLDDVEVVVDDLRVRKEVLHPLRVRARHVHADVLDPLSPAFEPFFKRLQRICAPPVADEQHVAGLRVAYDRHVLPLVGPLVEHAYLVDRQRLHALQRYVGVLLPEIVLLHLLDPSPRQTERLRERLYRHLAAKGHDCLLELLCTAARRLAEERDALDPRLAAVGAVQPMDGEPDRDRDKGVGDAVHRPLAQLVGVGVNASAARTLVRTVCPLDMEHDLRLATAAERELLDLRRILDKAFVGNQDLPDHLKSVERLCILSGGLHMASFLFLVELRNYMQSACLPQPHKHHSKEDSRLKLRISRLNRNASRAD